ncbi:MAG: precorrin-3B C(17)-methyltransferase [Bacteroidaceae bacterium]|nr:precorrin-3B C(17)-methyltransferase [Bacteroidaceae bacterium]
MMKGKIIVVGIGPGNKDDITPAVVSALRVADVVVGYHYYFQFVQVYVSPECQCVDTGMKKERERAQQAFDLAEQGKTVMVMSSGDAGIYGMAPLIFEMASERDSDMDIEVLPGISAFQKAAALLGAPVGHDFCVISLSDLLTTWEKIERRIHAAAEADFVTAIYNPKSNGRYWQLYRLKEIFLQLRDGNTPVGYVHQAGREEEKVCVTTLKDFDPEDVDMFTVVLIGNSQSYKWQGKMVTPRGYKRALSPPPAPPRGRETIRMASPPLGEDGKGLGQSIMMESFRRIRSELSNQDVPLWKLWPMIHAIHTTADFEMENLLYSDENAVPMIFEAMKGGKVSCIITDVTMAASGIRKAACQRYGIEVKCYLQDERVADMAASQNITRSQAGIRLAVEEHPDALFVFGNAPTALMELCDLMRKGKAHPVGIVAAPVGFVHVCESKYMVKSFLHVPKLIIEGRKGGSNIAATLVNSILAWDDAEELKPGRDV